MSEPFRGAASASVAQRIHVSDVVVRASLLSTSEGSLRFRAVEYLKGSGPTEFTVSASTANRNTVWDGREAVLFLSRQPGGDATGSSGSNTTADFQFANTTSWNYSQNPTFAQHYSGDLPQGYTVDSRNPVWLPAESGTGGAVGASDSGSSFITALTSPEGSSQPVISLADLRATIAWIEGGEGIEGYDLCIKVSLATERYYRDWEAYHRRPWVRFQETHEVSSGAGASTVVYDYNPRRSTKYDAPYLTGPDASFFRAQNIDDDALSSNGYHERLATARPLPAGTYRFISHLQQFDEIPCAFRPDYDGLEYLITVTAPAGTLHESFFDPVDLSGSRVGATGSSGVIDPEEFTVAGDDYEIESLVWGANSVVLELDDYVSLSGQTLDFIELDGSIDTSLDNADATVNQTAATWTWSVDSQPWEDGDLLMLRIRDTSTGPTVVILTIHQPTRLRIMTLLAAQPKEGRVAYGFIQGNLGLTGGNLTIHLRKLEEAGYVAMSKEFIGAKPRTWVEAMPKGRQAYAAYLESLRRLLGNGGAGQ